MTDADRWRLFFALWPQRALLDPLQALQHRLAADLALRWVPASNWHVTLAFLGPVMSERVSDLAAAADRLSVRRFALTLDRLEWWPAGRALCLTARHEPEELHRLVAGLKAAGAPILRRPDVRPFRAHLTLALGVREDPGPLCLSHPLVLHAEAFHLVRSCPAPFGSVYTRIGDWPLNG